MLKPALLRYLPDRVHAPAWHTVVRVIALGILILWYADHLDMWLPALKPNPDIVDIGAGARVYIDPTGSLNEHDVLHLPEHAWSTRSPYNFGLTRAAVWLMLPLPDHVSARSHQKLIYTRDSLDSADAFIIHPAAAGYSLTPLERVPQQLRPTFTLPRLAPDDRVLLRVANKNALWGRPLLLPDNAYTATHDFEQVGIGFFIGAISLMAIFNILNFSSSQQPIFFVYSGFMISISMIFFVDFGAAGLVFNGEFFFLSKDAIPFYTFTTWSFTLFFVALYLDTKHLHPTMDKILKGGSLLQPGLMMISFFIPYHDAIYFIVLESIAIFMVIIGLTIHAIAARNRHAFDFMKSWLWVIMGSFGFCIFALGVADPGPYTILSMPMGILLQGLTFSHSLVKKLNDREREAFEAKRQTYDLAKTYATKLEVEVREKTHHLIEAQKKLVASEKTSALGIFTAGMAHEINNPANFVSVGLQNASAQLQQFRSFINELLDEDTDDEMKRAFEQHFHRLSTSHDTAMDGIKRIENVVKHLRMINPEGTTGFQSVDVIDIIEAAWRVTHATMKIAIDLQVDCEIRPKIACMVADLNQMFMALLSNAAHAIEDAITHHGNEFQGRIYLRARHINDRVLIQIEDNGTGIAPGVQDKIFDPFFTTKGIGRGAGLGLSMARDVVSRHGGHIDVFSRPGAGATFTVTLPLTPP